MHDKLFKVLHQFLPGHDWDIEKPRSGWRKESYIACNGRHRYFIKFDVPVEILRRLGQIGVAPRVLFCGQENGLGFVVQEFVDGVHPESQAWTRRHVDELISVVRTYHEDRLLCDQLATRCASDFRPHIQLDLEWLSDRYTGCDSAYLNTEQVKAAFQQLVNGSLSLEAEPLTPIHNDPSPTNILLAGGRFIFLDWDEITLSDPMRDIGLLLWWNFPPSQWPLFFQKYGAKLSAARLVKIYWFAARASFDIALWHAEHNVDGRGFVDDFLAAIQQRPNPKGY